MGRRLKQICGVSHIEIAGSEKKRVVIVKKGRPSGGAACHKARQSDEASNEKGSGSERQGLEGLGGWWDSAESELRYRLTLPSSADDGEHDAVVAAVFSETVLLDSDVVVYVYSIQPLVSAVR